MPLNSNKKPSRKAKILPQFSFYSGNKPLLDLLEIQRKSFFDLLEHGIIEELSKTDSFRETAKFSGFTQELELAFNPETYKLVSPNCTPREAILKGKTYACKLYVQATLTIRSSPHGSAVETDRKLVFSRIDGDACFSLRDAKQEGYVSKIQQQKMQQKSFGAKKMSSTFPYLGEIIAISDCTDFKQKHQGNVSYSVNNPNFSLLQSLQPLQPKVFLPSFFTRGAKQEGYVSKVQQQKMHRRSFARRGIGGLFTHNNVAQIFSPITPSLTNPLQSPTVQKFSFKESFFSLPFKFPEKFCNYASKSKFNISNDFLVKVPSNFFETYSTTNLVDKTKKRSNVSSNPFFSFAFTATNGHKNARGCARSITNKKVKTDLSLMNRVFGEIKDFKPNQTEHFSKVNIQEVKSLVKSLISNQPLQPLVAQISPQISNQSEIANEISNKNGSVKMFRPWIFLGELPLMTKRGHFILNGSPRVIVNQIARCPGIYFQEKRRGVGFEQEVRVSADLIPQRGPWLRIQSDWEGRFWARLKREGRVKYATLYEAFQESEKQYNAPLVSLISNSSSSLPKSEILAFHERKAKEDRQKKALVRLFKNSMRYSLGKQGRLRINQRVHINRPEKIVPATNQSALLVTKTNSSPSRFLQSVVHTSLLHPVTSNENKAFRILQQIGCFASHQLGIKDNQFGFYTVGESSTMKNFEQNRNRKLIQPSTFATSPLQSMESLRVFPEDPREKILEHRRSRSKVDEIGAMKDFKASHEIIVNKFFRKNRTHNSETLLTAADINAVHTFLERLLEGKGFTDDIDHLKNRLVRTSGKLLQHQLELGLTKLNEVITPLLGNLIQGQLLSSSEDTKVLVPKKRITASSGSQQQMAHQKKGLAKVIDNSNGEHTSLPLALHRESPLVKVNQGDQIKQVGQHKHRAKSVGEIGTIRDFKEKIEKSNKHLTNHLVKSVVKSLQSLQPSVAQIAQISNQPLQPKVFAVQSKKMHKELPLQPLVAQVKAPQIPSFSLENETPFRWLRTSKPVNNAFREFFGSNPLSQYMDQTNPLAEITHKRRLSSMGPGGIKRETAGMEVRGIHPTHYGRVCPIETPEGKNAGLVNSPTVYGRINKNGFMETPLYQVLESQVQKERWTFFSAQQEEDEESSLATGDIGLTRFNVLPQLPIPVQTANNPLAHFQQIERNRVGYKALSPVQTISIATALIPFLEHDDANRALMGSNMQRQAIPLLLSERPIVGTGFESMVMVESGESVQATKMGYVSHVSANQIIIESKHLTWKAPPSVGFCKLSPLVKSNISKKTWRIQNGDHISTIYRNFFHTLESSNNVWWNRSIFTRYYSVKDVLLTNGKKVQSFALLSPKVIFLLGLGKKKIKALDDPWSKPLQPVVKSVMKSNQSLKPLVVQIGLKSKISPQVVMLIGAKQQMHNKFIPFLHSSQQFQRENFFSPLQPGLIFSPPVNIFTNSFSSAVDPVQPKVAQGAMDYLQSKIALKDYSEPLQPVQVVQVAQGVPNFLEFASRACTTYAIGGAKQGDNSQQATIAFTCTLMEAGSSKACTDENNNFNGSKERNILTKSMDKSIFDWIRSQKQKEMFYIAKKIPHQTGLKSLVKSVQSVQPKVGLKSVQSKIAMISPVNLQLCITQEAFFLKKNSQPLQIYQRSNQETCLSHRPLVAEGEWVFKGDILADSSASHSGDLALGKNVTVAYMPWEGYNFEDAIVISDRLVADDVYTSIHIERYEIKVSKNSQGRERITNQIPSLPSQRLKHLDNSGIARVSSWVQPGDILVGKVVELKRPLSPYERLAWELASRLSPNSPEREKWLSKVWLEDISLRLPPGVCGRVINFQVLSTEWSEKEQLTRPLEVHIYLAVKRKIQVGDKLAGRHGNKGIVSIVLPRQDMPYLADGTSVDMVLNPLGVPSRMNLGQIFECLLGLAGSQLGCNFKVTPFDEIAGGEASRSLVFLKLYQCRLIYKQQWLFTPTFPGKNKLFDGRTGEPFENWVTVGRAYMLKLIHMVDHKIHARSTGPYSLFTRQPVRGRYRRGGQRLGEMEVWAVEGFGAAYTLQEFLTVKSDDLKARAALQRSFYKQNDVTLGKVEISPGNPEAFRVLVSELQALCLHIQM